MLISTSVLSAPPEVVILGTQHWPPYQVEQNNQLSGIAIESVVCVLKRMQQRYRFVVKPWQRIQNEVANGQLDGFFSASQSHDRDLFAVQSAPFIRQRWVFYLLKDSLIAPDISAIKAQAKLAARQNSNVYRWLANNGYRIEAAPNDAEALIGVLHRKRVDAVMENSTVFEYHLNRLGVGLNGFHQVINLEHNLGVYFGKPFVKKHPEFLERFNRESDYCSNILG
ncbi:MAG: transporter substrate-binding domain-containing protein [Halopseudomonas sp.]